MQSIGDGLSNFNKVRSQSKDGNEKRFYSQRTWIKDWEKQSFQWQIITNWHQFSIKNTVAALFWSIFVKCIFDCCLSHEKIGPFEC